METVPPVGGTEHRAVTVFIFELGNQDVGSSTGIFDFDWDGEHAAGIGQVEWLTAGTLKLYFGEVWAKIRIDSCSEDAVGTQAWPGQVRRKLTGTVIAWSDDEVTH